MGRHFSKEDIQMTTGMKRCSISLVIQGNALPKNNKIPLHNCQNSYHQKKPTNNKCWQRCGEKETLVCCWWNFNWCTTMKNSMQVPPKTKNRTTMPWVAQLQSTLWDPKDFCPPGSSAYGESPDKNTGVGCHALLQGELPYDPAIPLLGINPKKSKTLQFAPQCS